MLPPFLLPPVSLVSRNRTLLLDHFIQVWADFAPGLCHSSLVGAGQEVTAHGLVWAFCSRLTAYSHQESNDHRYALIGCQLYRRPRVIGLAELLIGLPFLLLALFLLLYLLKFLLLFSLITAVFTYERSKVGGSDQF